MKKAGGHQVPSLDKELLATDGCWEESQFSSKVWQIVSTHPRAHGQHKLYLESRGGGRTQNWVEREGGRSGVSGGSECMNMSDKKEGEEEREKKREEGEVGEEGEEEGEEKEEKKSP